MNHLHYQYFPGEVPTQIPLVLLHGFLGDSNEWRNVIQPLSKTQSCIVIELPGHGLSRDVRLDETKGFSQTSQLISNTLKQIRVKRYALLGYSLGGRIALYHAKYHAKYHATQVAALIVESSHPGLESELEKSERLTGDQGWAKRFLFEPLPAVLEDWYRQKVFSQLSAQQRQMLVARRLEITPQAVVNMLLATSLARQEALQSVFLNSDFPCYYFYGEKDDKYRQLAQQLKAANPKLNLIGFTDAGHNVHLEQPVDFVKKVQDICDRLR